MSIAEQIHDLGKLLYSGELIDLAKQVEALEAASAKQQAALTVAISDLTLISKQKTVERKAEGFFTREIHKPTAAAIVAIQTLEAIDEALNDRR